MNGAIVLGNTGRYQTRSSDRSIRGRRGNLLHGRHTSTRNNQQKTAMSASLVMANSQKLSSRPAANPFNNCSSRRLRTRHRGRRQPLAKNRCAVKLQLVAVCDWPEPGSGRLWGSDLSWQGQTWASRWHLPPSGKVGPMVGSPAAAGPAERKALVQSVGAHVNCWPLVAPRLHPRPSSTSGRRGQSSWQWYTSTRYLN